MAQEAAAAAAAERYWAPLKRAIDGGAQKHQADLARSAATLSRHVKAAADQFVKLGADGEAMAQLAGVLESIRDVTSVEYGRMALDAAGTHTAVSALLHDQRFTQEGFVAYKKAELLEKGGVAVEAPPDGGVVFDIPAAAAATTSLHSNVYRAMDSLLKQAVGDDELQMAPASSAPNDLKDPYTRQTMVEPVKLPCGHTHCKLALAKLSTIKCGRCRAGPFRMQDLEVDHETALALEEAKAARRRGGGGGAAAAAAASDDDGY